MHGIQNLNFVSCALICVASHTATRALNKIHSSSRVYEEDRHFIAPFGDAYEKIGTIQRRLAWPLHKDDTLFQSGRPTGLNIYFLIYFFDFTHSRLQKPQSVSLVLIVID